MKTLGKIAITASILALCGCGTLGTKCGDGPVAPDSISREKGASEDPKLPFMIPWWKFQ